MTLPQLALGAALAVAIAAAAYRLGSLSASGAAGAVLVGTLTFGIGGWVPAILLSLFFVSSSGLSRVGHSRKTGAAATFSKGSRRDIGQVMANGGLASALSIGYGLTREPFWLVGLAGALAAVNADTWATELGILSRVRPRLITTGASVDPGTSGGVSLQGTLAAAAGSAVIGATAGLLTGDWFMAAAAWAGGLAGSLFDSLLGATIQAMFWCPACLKETERHPLHACGAHTQPVRGWHWLGNDAVNFAASLFGAGAALLIATVG